MGKSEGEVGRQKEREERRREGGRGEREKEERERKKKKKQGRREERGDPTGINYQFNLNSPEKTRWEKRYMSVGFFLLECAYETRLVIEGNYLVNVTMTNSVKVEVYGEIGQKDNSVNM